MKLRFKYNKRFNLYTTLFACAVGLWMMVTRFGLPVETLLSYAIICLALLVLVVGIAALLAFIIRKISDNKSN